MCVTLCSHLVIMEEDALGSRGSMGKGGPRTWKDLRIPPAGICVLTIL